MDTILWFLLALAATWGAATAWDWHRGQREPDREAEIRSTLAANWKRPRPQLDYTADAETFAEQWQEREWYDRPDHLEKTLQATYVTKFRMEHARRWGWTLGAALLWLYALDSLVPVRHFFQPSFSPLEVGLVLGGYMLYRALEEKIKQLKRVDLLAIDRKLSHVARHLRRANRMIRGAQHATTRPSSPINKPSKVEDQLASDVLEDSPSGRLKLIAAWDGLPLEIQCRALRTPEPWGDLDPHVALKALTSSNEYVRYLAARGVSLSDDDDDEHEDEDESSQVDDASGRERHVRSAVEELLRHRIGADPSPLVRYAQDERRSHTLDEEFDAFPVERKLAILRSVHLRRGSEVAAWIERALTAHTSSEEEILACVTEYVRNYATHLRKEEEEGYTPFWWDLGEDEKDFNALWHLVPRVPPAIASELVSKLPAEKRGLGSLKIPDEVLDRLPRVQLEQLLYREDVTLPDFRKRVFFETRERDENEVYLLRPAAAWAHLSLTYEEFHDLLKTRSRLLRSLGSPHSLPVVFLIALLDYFDSLPNASDEKGRINFDTLAHFDECAGRRLEGLTGRRRSEELWELRVYELARKAMPWRAAPIPEEVLDYLDEPSVVEAVKEATQVRVGEGEPWLSDRFGFLREKVVRDDTWGTYIEFHKALKGWSLKGWPLKALPRATRVEGIR
jgi:hypothetical protein